MKKKLLALMMGVVSTNAAAEWSLAAHADNYDVYVHAATIRKVGNIARVWDLTDYDTGQQSPAFSENYWSSKRQVEYDCEEAQVRILALLRYSEPKGTGKLLFSHSGKSDWKPLAPDTVGYTLWRVACGKNQ